MCHSSCFYLLHGPQTSKGHTAYESEDRIIPGHIGRHKRTPPDKSLDLETISGAEISADMTLHFLKQGTLWERWASIHWWRNIEPDQIPVLFQLFLIRGCNSILWGPFKKKNTHAGALHQTY